MGPTDIGPILDTGIKESTNRLVWPSLITVFTKRRRRSIQNGCGVTESRCDWYISVRMADIRDTLITT